MKDLEVDASSREDGRRRTFESEFFWGPVLRSDPSIRPKHFGARTSADARDHVAPPSQVSQGAQELRRGDRAREGCDQLLPGTSRPAPNTRRPRVGRISLLSGDPYPNPTVHFGPPSLPTRGRRVAIVRAITPPPRGACSIGR